MPPEPMRCPRCGAFLLPRGGMLVAGDTYKCLVCETHLRVVVEAYEPNDASHDDEITAVGKQPKEPKEQA
jgi:DNA-directed RNA polymerase subunit RPC12/RpoP